MDYTFGEKKKMHDKEDHTEVTFKPISFLLVNAENSDDQVETADKIVWMPIVMTENLEKGNLGTP